MTQDPHCTGLDACCCCQADQPVLCKPASALADGIILVNLATVGTKLDGVNLPIALIQLTSRSLADISAAFQGGAAYAAGSAAGVQGCAPRAAGCGTVGSAPAGRTLNPRPSRTSILKASRPSSNTAAVAGSVGPQTEQLAHSAPAQQLSMRNSQPQATDGQSHTLMGGRWSHNPTFAQPSEGLDKGKGAMEDQPLSSSQVQLSMGHEPHGCAGAHSPAPRVPPTHSTSAASPSWIGAMQGHMRGVVASASQPQLHMAPDGSAPMMAGRGSVKRVAHR